MNAVERAYGKSFRTILWLIKPFKKYFVETLCEVHVFINNQAMEILRNDGHPDAYDFLNPYLEYLHKGVVWADQDFRSREHFYNPYTHKGLYGCKSSKQRFEKYYHSALVHWENGDPENAMFCLGAAIHLIQDATIPQHGSVNLLKSHRSYEQWVIKVHDDFSHYSVTDGGIYYDSPYSYIDSNAKMALQTYRRYSLIKDLREKYFKMGNVLFPLAQKTTAGCLLNFYDRVIH